MEPLRHIYVLSFGAELQIQNWVIASFKGNNSYTKLTILQLIWWRWYQGDTSAPDPITCVTHKVVIQSSHQFNTFGGVAHSHFQCLYSKGWLVGCILFYVPSAIFQPFAARSSFLLISRINLYTRSWGAWICASVFDLLCTGAPWWWPFRVLAHWCTMSQINITHHLVTLYWHRANQ